MIIVYLLLGVALGAVCVALVWIWRVEKRVGEAFRSNETPETAVFGGTYAKKRVRKARRPVQEAQRWMDERTTGAGR